MNLIDRIARLQALDPDLVWSVEDYMQIVEMLPGLLDALVFRPGDAAILEAMAIWFSCSDDPAQFAVQIEVLRRYQAMAERMEESK